MVTVPKLVKVPTFTRSVEVFTVPELVKVPASKRTPEVTVPKFVKVPTLFKPGPRLR